MLYNAGVFGAASYLFRLPRWVWVGPLAGLMAMAGCGPASSMHLLQPHLSGWQRHLHLTAENAWWSPGHGVDRVLVEYPPPGAITGRPLLLLYLRLPFGVAEPTVAAPTGPAARGFFIQTRGEYAGLSTVVGGRVIVRGRSLSLGAKREVAVELKCEDGSALVGTIEARRDDWALRQFETQRRPVDVDMLIRAGKAAPATRPGR